MFSPEDILQKKNFRNDSIWTHPFLYDAKFLRRIPLFLDTWALSKSQYWDRKKMLKYQKVRLEKILRFAASVPMWQEIFEGAKFDLGRTFDFESFKTLPILSKKDLVNMDFNKRTNPSLWPKSARGNTSGSTGRPFTFLYDHYSELRSFAVTERLLRTATNDVRFPVVYMHREYRHGFTFHKHYTFLIRGYTGVKHRLQAFIDFSRKFKEGFILYGYTSVIIEAARRIHESGRPLPIRAVMATGEGIRPSDRDLIEKNLRTNFYLVYATRELGWLASECKNKKLHINEEWAYIEIVDKAGNSLVEGSEGRIIVTTFDNRVMPFIRYDTGDIGVISSEPCPCGRTLRTIRLQGRSIEYINLPDGRVIPILGISTAFDAYSKTIIQFQIVQRGLASFLIKVIPGVNFEKNKDILSEKIVRSLHPSVHVEWEIVEHIPEAPSGKALYFVREYSDVRAINN